VKQPFVVWDDRFSIGIGTVDDQHKGLFTLTNDLHDAYQKTDTVEHFKLRHNLCIILNGGLLQNCGFAKHLNFEEN